MLNTTTGSATERLPSCTVAYRLFHHRFVLRNREHDCVSVSAIALLDQSLERILLQHFTLQTVPRVESLVKIKKRKDGQISHLGVDPVVRKKLLDVGVAESIKRDERNLLFTVYSSPSFIQDERVCSSLCEENRLLFDLDGAENAQ